ncbi:Dabb family protein [Dokdonia pacifica]|uniref:Stress responsive A/B Barrel Domain n=1 Tax=Dokdonia pacifica TaxID=1627892 RepID=A0A238YG56_9FLAO|nr:Dabb family protein [Dokdonia pacifica]SNR69603.1 Stress responsive A/B Barrel Domain [Dokdonia pacifica]
MKKIITLLFITYIISSCSNQTTTTSMPIQGDFAHTVYFWLHRPDNPDDRKAFEASLTSFINQSPYITTKHIGVPAATNRDVIDNSYTYSLLLTFKDKAAQDQYQDEPAHKQFIAESSHLWSKVLVYDSEDILE